MLRVLDADPDLGAALAPERLRTARDELLARGFRINAGVWRDSMLERLARGGVGLLVLDGVLTRELVMSDNVTTELLGAGDVIATSGITNPSRLLRSHVRWSVLEPARVAVLGPSFMTAVVRYPEVNSALIGRLVDRSHRLAVAQAISQLNGVDRRILTLLWHLAERWGRITADGVAVRLVLPHRLIAQLIGARRPTVSTALRALSDCGSVSRLPDGTWLLHGDPVGLPTDDASRVIRLRRPRAETSELSASR
jgi:CRP/FNR family transcriptional regulator, cyclic AMP receptor protein